MEGEILLTFIDPSWFLPFLLYAETHYRFKYFLSFLKKREPELLADAPHRVEPGRKIPILILSKDAHRFPCELTDLSVDIRQHGRTLRSVMLLTHPVQLNKKWWWRIFYIDSKGCSGWIELDVAISISVDGKSRVYRNDNYRTSSHRSLRIFLAESTIPKMANLFLGDCHTHSHYTDDQVEFGAPIEAAIDLSVALGLSFFCVTDHSYDLDDHEDDYLINHPLLPKWRAFQAEVDAHNDAQTACVIVRGEEVTSRNTKSENVHLLVLGDKIFFEGAGDSAEQWFRTASKHSVKEVAFRAQGMAFAAHPQEHVPILQRVLLGRGNWNLGDLRSPGLHGIQFANGTKEDGFERGKVLWIKALLLGQRLIAIAGNDAHGNFNRFRQLGVPFVIIRESRFQILGKMRTGVFLKGRPTEARILAAIRRGNAIMTDGPAASFQIRLNNLRTQGEIGGRYTANEAIAMIQILSSPEYGPIESAEVFCGTIGDVDEQLIFESRPRVFQWTGEIKLQIRQPLYVRLEVSTSGDNVSGGQTHFCITNPIWLSPLRPDLKRKAPRERGFS